MEEIIKKYAEKHIEADLNIKKANLTVDFKTNNKERKKLEKLFSELSKDRILFEAVYAELLESSEEVTLLTASSECLKNKIFVKKAEENLLKLSKRKDLAMISFEAEMVLKVWYGEIKGKTL